MRILLFLLLLFAFPALFQAQEKGDNPVNFQELIGRQKTIVRAIAGCLERDHPDSAMYFADPVYMKADSGLLRKLKQATSAIQGLKDSTHAVLGLYSCFDSYTEYEYTRTLNKKDYLKIFIRMNKDSMHPAMLFFSIREPIWGESIYSTSKSTTKSGEDDKVFSFAERMPEFPGGDAMMHSYLKTNLHYPALEMLKAIQGSVVLSFYVSRDGSLHDFKILKKVSEGPGMSEEIIRLVLMMPLWKPGTMNGKPVNVQYNLPFSFVLR
jgi:hypothetical protein